MLIQAQPIIVINQPVPFDEKVRDHNALLEAFFNTHGLGHSDRTLKFDQRYIGGWFNSHKVQDNEHPEGRQLFVWEAMDPITGPEIIKSYSAGLAETALHDRTCSDYLGRLKFFFDFVLSRKTIPAASTKNEVAIADKYNAIINPVSKHLYPPIRGVSTVLDYPLVEEGLNDFLCWIREDWLPIARNPFVTGRTYTHIITVAECGFRYCELEGLDALKPMRDIFPLRGKIRTRFGKATNGSGPRMREVELTPLARETLKHYERFVRPRFPNAETEPALFLTGRGAPVGYWVAKSALEVIVREARAAGLVLPNDMGWHSFRRSFATQFLQRHPDRIWDLLQRMGHQNHLTLIGYVRPTEEAVNDELARYIELLVARRVA